MRSIKKWRERVPVFFHFFLEIYPPSSRSFSVFNKKRRGTSSSTNVRCWRLILANRYLISSKSDAPRMPWSIYNRTTDNSVPTLTGEYLFIILSCGCSMWSNHSTLQNPTALIGHGYNLGWLRHFNLHWFYCSYVYLHRSILSPSQVRKLLLPEIWKNQCFIIQEFDRYYIILRCCALLLRMFNRVIDMIWYWMIYIVHLYGVNKKLGGSGIQFYKTN